MSVTKPFISKLITPVIGTEVTPAFCRIASLSAVTEANVSSVITDNNVVVTNTTGQGIGFYRDIGILVNLGANILVAEITVNSLSSLTNGIVALGFLTTDTDTGEGFVIEINTGVGDGRILRTSDNAPVLTGLSLTLPYTAQLIVDGNTGDVSFNDGVNPVTLLSNIPTIDTIDGTFQLVAFPPAGLNEIAEFTANLGSQAMTITPPSGSVFWCDVVQVPIIFCSFLSLVAFQDIGNPDTTIVDNTITVTNVGGGVDQGAQTGTQSFTSSTDTVAIELTFDASTPDPSTNAFYSLIFWDGADPTTANILCGLDIINVNSTNTTINDARSGQIITGLTTAAGYTVGIEFDTSGSGSATFKDSIGTDLALSVSPGFNNANPIFIGVRARPLFTNGNDYTVTLNAGDHAFTFVNGTRRCNV